MKELTTSYLARKVNGKLWGKDKVITGIFNILKDAKKEDVVVRHWIDDSGVEMADSKGVACIVTQDARGSAVSTAQKLDLPLIITEKIELINAFAIRWALDKFAPESLRLVITGTNGKSTTSHMIHHIMKEAGYQSYTNTDSLSEFNTLIDPMVAKQIAEKRDPEVLVIEVSEVQGWDDRIMKNHAFLMTQAIQPDVLVLTNVAMDHVGLVNSIEDAFHEIAGSLKGFNGRAVVLNQDDPLIMKMKDMVPPEAKILSYGTGGYVEMKEDRILLDGKILLTKDKLPFQSPHFIQNTMAAVAAARALKVETEIIKKAVASYCALKRRFKIINKTPLIIDDFAHNPAGIKATIKSTALISQGKLYVVCAIRGSRGIEINKINAAALAESLQNLDYILILTSSQDVVDEANVVQPPEKKIFIEVLQKKGIQYTHYSELNQALKEAIDKSGGDDTILLIGAQGMDPASEVLDGFKEK